jgi:hypothetical protein
MQPQGGDLLSQYARANPDGPDYSGIVCDLPDTTYHAHSALSSTQARLLLDAPARYHYAQTHPQPYKKAFDLGSLVHSKVLGVGAGIAVIPTEILASNGATSTTAAKAFIAEARAEGLIPVKQDVANEVAAMTESVLAHTEARGVLETVDGREVSLFADVEGVPTRARFDIYDGTNAADLKSARDASPRGFNTAVGRLGYHVQDRWYSEAHEAVTGTELESFKFLVVENVAPYLVGVYDLDFMWEHIAKEQTKRARELYLSGMETGVWPGYSSATLTPPAWAVYENDDNEMEIH